LDGQARCFDLFESFADEQARALWQALQAAPAIAELERMRRMALSAGAREGGQVQAAQGERWFALTTARIDAMKQVEDHLQTRLYDQCAARLAEARDSLGRQDLLAPEAEAPGSPLHEIPA